MLYKFFLVFSFPKQDHFQAVIRRNDWDIFLAASRALFRGEDIYAITYFDGYHYYYSLLFATVLYPFTWLPVVTAKFVWIFLNPFFFDWIFLRFWAYFDLAAGRLSGRERCVKETERTGLTKGSVHTSKRPRGPSCFAVR